MDEPGASSEAVEGGADPAAGREEAAPPRSARVLYAVALLLTLGGIGAAIELTRIHYLTHTDPSYHSICAVNETVNCETVAQSPYSVFLGLPISVWGVIAYTAWSLLFAWGLVSRRLHRAWPAGLLFAAALIASGVSALMAYISFVRIDALCLFCATLYAISGLLLPISGAILFTVRVHPLAAIGRDLAALLRRPVLLAALLALAGASVGVTRALVQPWWHHPGWEDLADLPSGVDENGHHWIGAADPILTVVEWSDYECPYCRRAHKNMRTMVGDHRDEVRLIHRHVPLDQSCNDQVKRPFHRRACEFARAAECAAEQGRFWEMNDALFSVQNDVRARDVDIKLLAVQLGLDRSRFDECLASPRPARAVARDLAEAHEKKIRGTPTFFIRSQPYPGGFSEGILENALEQERAARGEGASPDAGAEDLL